MRERGYWLDTATGEVTPVPEAPYGYVAIPADMPKDTEYVAIGCRWGREQGHWVDHYVRPAVIRPATKEEAEGNDA